MVNFSPGNSVHIALMAATMATETVNANLEHLLHTVSSVSRIEGGYDNMANSDHNSTAMNTMNVETHTQELAPESTSHQFAIKAEQSGDLFGKLLHPILANKRGLSEIPQVNLRQNLHPVITALQNLDAEELLGLQPASSGPVVRDGRCCRPIYDDIAPAVPGINPEMKQSCVRYLHLAEVPDQYSIGIFVFAPYSVIPLHDHPGMCVLSRVLYGDLKRTSLDLAREQNHGNGDGEKKSWLGGLLGKPDPPQAQPTGSRQAIKNSVDYLHAPGVTMLYPYEGNLHEFTAGPDGAAVLDVLLPPYDNHQNRDCTFYEIKGVSQAGMDEITGPCEVVPTGQPESFHCISGQYGDIGQTDDFDIDHETQNL